MILGWFRRFEVCVVKILLLLASLSFVSPVASLAEGDGCLQLGVLSMLADREEILTATKQIFRDAGECVEITALPTRRSEMLSTSGTLDGEVLRTAYWASQHQDQMVMVPTPLFTDQIVAVSLETRNLELASIADLKPYRVVISVGHRWGEAQLAAIGVQPMETNSPARFVELIKIGRVDIGMVEQSMFSHFGRMEGLRISPLTPLAYHMVLNREHEGLIPAIDAALQRFQAAHSLR